MILSGSNALISLEDGSPVPATVSVGSTNNVLPLRFWVRDLHGNVMPGDTTVSLSVSGAALQVTAPSSFNVPCSSIAAGTKFDGITVFPFRITSGSTIGVGSATLTVRTPNGVQTISQFSVSVP